MSAKNGNQPHEWTKRELAVFARLKSPYAVQEYLNDFPYRKGVSYFCPRQVMAEKRADCFDGALLAAVALRRIGYPPLIMDLRSDETDDDHVVTVFQERGCYGALGSSNYVGLSWREPIYRSPRELAISYFEMFFNLRGQKTLREYSRPFNLSRYDRYHWPFQNRILKTIAADLDNHMHYDLVSKKQVKRLNKIDRKTLKVCTSWMFKDGYFQG